MKWLKMGKNRRSKLDQKDKIKVMNRKKNLIAKTRKEYFKLKGGNK